MLAHRWLHHSHIRRWSSHRCRTSHGHTWCTNSNSSSWTCEAWRCLLHHWCMLHSPLHWSCLTHTSHCCSLTNSSACLCWWRFCAHCNYVISSEKNKAKRSFHFSVFLLWLFRFDFPKLFCISKHAIHMLIKSNECSN